MFPGDEEFFGNNNGEFLLFSKRVYRCAVLVAVKVDRLCLLGEHDRGIVEMPCSAAGNANPGSFNSEDLVNLDIMENSGPFFAHSIEQGYITLVVEERINF